jgi:hypothetical protein
MNKVYSYNFMLGILGIKPQLPCHKFHRRAANGDEIHALR